MADILEVNSLQVRTQVGFSPHELNKLQEINITFKLYTDTSTAGETDDIQHGINIKPICKEIISHVEGKKYALIEAIAEDVACICLHSGVNRRVDVKIEKPNAIRFSKFSAVTISRVLSDLPSYDVIISIGSNIEPAINVAVALRQISQRVGPISNISKCYQTPAIDSSCSEDKKGGSFYNVAVEVSTHFNQVKLKDELLMIEDDMGRVRDLNDKFAPRCIDLDISFHASSTPGSGAQTWIDVEDIKRFPHVAVPLSDIIPDFKSDATAGASILSLAQQLTKLHVPSDYFPQIELEIPEGEFRKTKTTDSCVNEPGVKLNDCIQQNACSNNENTADNKTVNIKTPKSNVSTSSCNTTNVLSSCDTSKQSSNKVALITGGASKIGAHLSHRLHRNGYNVAIHYCNGKKVADDLTALLNDAREGSAIAVQADLSVSPGETSRQVVEQVVKQWGRLDVLVNNASVFYQTPISATDQEVWSKILTTNLSSPFFLIQSATRHLTPNKGCIINICDIHGTRPLLNHAAYSVSKAALIALTQSAALELGQSGVRVNGVSPGAISWVQGKHSEEYKRNVVSKTALKATGSAEDVGIAVDFVINNQYLTGQIINVDGGRTLNQ